MISRLGLERERERESENENENVRERVYDWRHTKNVREFSHLIWWLRERVVIALN
jgi:hypothetical protein